LQFKVRFLRFKNLELCRRDAIVPSQNGGCHCKIATWAYLRPGLAPGEGLEIQSMSRFEFRLPDIGEGVTEGEIVLWSIKPGDQVVEDQQMLEIMTDKATVSITSPVSGLVKEIHGKVGEVVQIHALLVAFEVEGEIKSTGSGGHGHAPAPAASAPAAPAPAAPAPAPAPAASVAAPAPSLPHGAGEGNRAPGYFNDNPLATPATRKAARELGLDLKTVAPTGPQGRVTKADVEAHAARGPASAPASASAGSTAASAKLDAGREPVRIAPPAAKDSALEERVPFAGMRRKISQKMALSKHTAAHFTFVEECDVTALKALRAKLMPEAQKQGVKLTFLPFIVKAVVAALKKHKVLNSALDEATQELVYRKYYHIGIAASTDAGLMVPVVRDCDRRSILEIAREIERLGADAKAGQLKTHDLSGSTFTITSLGAQGGLFATPILNFPEVGILGIHKIKERPVVKDGAIVIGEVMLLSLSFDHRIVDGHVGAAFAYDVIGYLENPDRLFLDMA
jgi:pyruvate dehydrogenase E2 component (dihydrolipoamide acetyltransferase)